MTPRQAFLESLARCNQRDDFIDKFYDAFQKSSDEVRLKFRHTDFEQQRRMLWRSLQLCAAATEGQPEGLQELNDRGTSHDRRHLNIKPELYELWLESLIATASDCDEEWDSRLEETWRRLLGYVISRMVARY